MEYVQQFNKLHSRFYTFNGEPAVCPPYSSLVYLYGLSNVLNFTRMGDAYISNIECDSENSIVEVEVPRKPSPPLIEIEEDDFYLNVTEGISLVSKYVTYFTNLAQISLPIEF